eukprot:m.73420 g.73420  ORF g.73420 m.73420 type:complete len:644 (-) comp12367_c3_seq1:206-2137(-)
MSGHAAAVHTTMASHARTLHGSKYPQYSHQSQVPHKLTRATTTTTTTTTSSKAPSHISQNVLARPQSYKARAPVQTGPQTTTQPSSQRATYVSSARPTRSFLPQLPVGGGVTSRRTAAVALTSARPTHRTTTNTAAAMAKTTAPSTRTGLSPDPSAPPRSASNTASIRAAHRVCSASSQTTTATTSPSTTIPISTHKQAQMLAQDKTTRFSSSATVSSASRSSSASSKTSSSTSTSSTSSSSSSKTRTPTLHTLTLADHTTGLRNLGNTCFLNSILQCLAHSAWVVHTMLMTDAVTHAVTKTETPTSRSRASRGGLYGGARRYSHASTQPFAADYADLLSAMWSMEGSGIGGSGASTLPTSSYSHSHSRHLVGGRGSAVAPSAIKAQLATVAPHLRGFRQQDAHEALTFLLSGIHTSLNRAPPTPIRRTRAKDLRGQLDRAATPDQFSIAKRLHTLFDDSCVHELFQGWAITRRKCHTCKYTCVSHQPYLDLSLPLLEVSNSSLKECLAKFAEPEVLSGADAPQCTKCNKAATSTRTIALNTLPKVLVLHLKRFDFSGTVGRKLHTRIQPPQRLTMSSEQDGPLDYKLVGVVEHSGSLNGGHYYAHCRHPVSGRWFDCNDSYVSPSTYDSISGQGCYLLVYEI